MVIYLKHPVHGSKVAISEFEAEEDKKNGWEVFDPEAVEVPAELPSFLSPAPAKRGRKVTQ